MRLLAREPAGRYATATDVRAALLGAGADDRATGVDATVSERPSRQALPPPPPPGARPGPGPRPTGATPSGGVPVRFAESERRWLVPTLVVALVAVALGVAGLLINESNPDLFGGDGDPPETTEAAPPTDELVTIAQTVDFDPFGGDGEHSDEARNGNAIDDNPATSWSTSKYNTPEWSGLKPGVGLILELDEPTDLRALSFDTPSSGWQAEVYVADAAADSLEGWGDPVATFDTSESGTATVEFEASGGAVLLWFTRAGDNGQVSVDEVRLER